MGLAETKQRLQQLVANGGVRQEDADLSLGWSIFKQFAVEPPKCPGGTISVSIGPDPRMAEQFVARFTRYCEINDDKDYVRTEAVSLLFITQPGEALRALRLSLSIDFMGRDTSFSAAEGSEAFRAALAHQPWRYSVEAW
jgi:hypothetical protein